MKFSVILIFISLCFLKVEAADPYPLPLEKIAERVRSHLIIGDVPAACSEAAASLQLHPGSHELWKVYIKSLAKSGDSLETFKAWKTYGNLFPESKYDKEILECMAWGIIEKGYASSSPIIRTIAILGAFFSKDAKGVSILLQGLSDENSFLRRASVKLSSELHDASLQEKLISMLEKEKVWSVRVEVIESLGKLKVISSKKALEKIVASNHFHAEEKAAAINAIVDLTEKVDDIQLKNLASSNRAGFRMLASEYIAFFNKEKSIPLLFPLTSDSQPNVRAKAMQALGSFKPSLITSGDSIASYARRGVSDPDPLVAVVSAYVLTIHSREEGMQAFEKLLKSPLKDTVYLAAATLAATGKYGLPLTKKVFRESPDIYVKMNLALGLIGQREDLGFAADCLYSGLDKCKEQWAFVEEDHVRVLVSGKIKHDDAIPNQPQTVNLLTRLEILQMLSVIHYPHAQQAIKIFLKESESGITGLASALLLTEGDEEAVLLVRNLINDSDQKVRVQAALILSLWGDGDEVIEILQNAYFQSDKELKAQILEGIGRAGSESALKFLADRLQEPYQTLRIVSAAALLECLYH